MSAVLSLARAPSLHIAHRARKDGINGSSNDTGSIVPAILSLLDEEDAALKVRRWSFV